MPLRHYLWSRTAASNATADPDINFQEGQAPSTVNDSARALMASAAGFRDDISGAIVTGGTSTAYTITSYQVFNNLANMNGQMIAFTPHVTNGATVTLNVDGLGAKPLRSAPSAELLAGTLILGTPYTALYNHTDQVFYLHGFFGNPYNVPFLGGMDHWDTVTPNSSFIFPAGQAISRTTYAAAFARWGTAFGAGDGSTTFNVPDKRGRVSAATDNMGGVAASRLTTTYFGNAATNLGSAGGGENATLTLAQLPTGITSSGSFTSSQNNVVTSNADTGGYSTGSGGVSQWQAWANGTVQSRISVTGSLSVTSNNTGGAPHRTIQPTIVCNYIIRII